MQMLDRQRVQQAAADEAKKLVDAAALASERLVDATKSNEDLYEVIIMDDSLRKLLPDLVILIEIEGV